MNARLLTAEDVAERLSLKRVETAREIMRARAHLKLGKLLRWTEEQLADYIKETLCDSKSGARYTTSRITTSPGSGTGRARAARAAKPPRPSESDESSLPSLPPVRSRKR